MWVVVCNVDPAQNGGTCPSGQSQWVTFVEQQASPWVMDLTSAGQISVAIMAVWALAWAAREIARLINQL